MRASAILALVVATAAVTATVDIYRTDLDETEYGSSLSSNRETIFRPGFEYIYRYESQVLTGVPSTNNKFGGIKINALVKMHFSRNEGVMLKMDRVVIYTVRDVMRSSNVVDILPNNELMRLSGEQEQAMVEQLLKPIKFWYEAGEIRDLRSTPGDKYWSINIKKGLVSLFQLKLSGRTSAWSDTESPLSTSSYKPGQNRLFDVLNPTAGRRMMTSRFENAFQVMESDVSGDCETKYVINTDTSDFRSAVPSMFISKVKNFQHCLNKHSYDEGLFAHLPQVVTEKNLIQPTFAAEYLVTGDRYNFLIKKVKVMSKYHFKPYGNEGGLMATHITQKLNLESSREAETPIMADFNVVEKSGLKMEIPRASWASYASEGIYDERFRGFDWKEKVDNKLNQLLSSIYPTVKESSALELMRFQRFFRSIPRHQLVAIVKSYVKQGSVEYSKKGEVLLDLLPTSINPETGNALLDLIRDGTIKGLRARLSIDAMVLTVKPTPEIIKNLMSIFHETDSVGRMNPYLRQTVLLGVGTLCNKMINHVRRVGKPIPELTSIVDDISQELISMLSSASSEKDKIRMLKAMGNMGAKEFINPIRSIIEDNSHPLSVRVEAVHALRKQSHIYAKLIQPLMISMIRKRNENTRLRIACIRTLKLTIPTFTTLQLLSNGLYDEPSTQIKTYIYTTLVSISNWKTDIPEIYRATVDARKVLTTMHSIPVGVLDSKISSYATFNERLNIGGIWDMETIKSSTSGLPRTIVNTLYANIFGKSSKVFEAGIDGENITPILRRLVGPYGLFKDIIKNKASVYDVLKPSTKPTGMTGLWRTLDEMKKFTTVMEDETDSSMFVRLLGYDVFYRVFDRDYIESNMNSVADVVSETIDRLREGVSLNTLKTFSLVGNSLVLPTPAGIPLSLNISTGAVLKLDGYVKMSSFPNFADFSLRRPFLSKKLDLEFDIKPSWSLFTSGYMGVDLQWLQCLSGVSVVASGSVPIKKGISVDPIDGKLTITYQPPSENTKLFHVKVEPFTVITAESTEMETLPRFKIWQARAMDPSWRKYNFESVQRSEVAEIEYAFKAQWSKCVSTWCPYTPLSGVTDLWFTFKSTSATPKELVISIKKFSQDFYEESYKEDPIDATSYGGTRNYRTYSSDVEDLSREFDSVSTDPFITSPRKLELLVDVGLKGYRYDKLFKGKITWLSENTYLEHQLNLQVIGVRGVEMDQVKFMLNGFWRYPTSVNFDNEDYSHVVKPNEVIGKIDFHWGRTGFMEKTIKGKVWRLDEDTWKHEVEAAGGSSSYDVNVLTYAPEAYNYGVEIMFPSISYQGQKYLTNAHDFIKVFWYRYMLVGSSVNNPPNKIIVFAQYIPKVSKVNMVIKTPRETDFVCSVPIDNPWSKLHRPRYYDYNPNYEYTNYTDYMDIDKFETPSYDDYNKYKDYTPSLRGMCTIHKDKMISFDGTPILLPIHHKETGGSRCDVLLARDCGERSLFAITGSFIHSRWAVKVIVPEHHIELVPKSGHEVEVKVDGKVVEVSYSHPLKLSEIPEEDRLIGTSSSLLSVKKIGNGFKVDLHEIGVTVSVEEHNKINVKVSPMSILHGRLCGLCGNHNYDVSDDMKSLEGKLTDSKQFVMDNVMESEYCDSGDYKTRLGERHEGYCRMKKTMMIEKTEDNDEMTCFSKNSVNVCRGHCKPTSTSSLTLRFVCMPSESTTTEQLINKFKSGFTDLTDELSSFSSSFEQTMEVPENCMPSW